MEDIIPFYSKMLKCTITKNKNIVLCNHSRAVDVRKFNIDMI